MVKRFLRLYDPEAEGAGGEGGGQGGTGDGAAEPAAPLNFLEHLPEDLRNDPTLVKTKGDLEVLARSHLSAQKMIGNRDLTNWVELPKVALSCSSAVKPNTLRR